MEDFKLEGLVAPTFTPMKADGEIDYDKIDAYSQYLSEEGVRQIYVNGSTGEGPSLTTEERMRLTECWIKEGRKNGRIQKIIVQVGGTSLKDSIEMTRHAASLGVDAVSSLPPIYYPVKNIDDLVEHCRLIAAAAPSIPFYYYHIPVRSGVNLPMDQFLLAGRDVIPTLRGIKFTDRDLVQMCACLRTKDAKGRNFNVLYGTDEQMMGAMALGADGAIGSTFNFMSGVYRRLVALLDKGEIKAARVEQYRSQDVVKEIFKFGERTNGTITTLKAVMSLAGFDMGPPRLPAKLMDQKDQEEFFQALKELGFLEWRK